ncbi:MAG TPA: type II toxin-antitoxin system HicB family antitoxin [Nitrospirae bacterium]|nr:type II toxin-antitoxin system HicB family antitoxin [Nitrospirota bacterium]
MKLRVVIEKDEEGFFTAEVPSLPGCLSQGNTEDQAIANVKEAIEGWLEVMESKRKIDKSQAVEIQV